MKYSKIWIPLVIFAQFAILGGMIDHDSLPQRFGKVVMIQTSPVDPRSFFQGDYVVLRYDFSRWNPDGPLPSGQPFMKPDEQQKMKGKNVYAILVKKDDSPFWTLERMTLTRPARTELDEHHLYLTGIFNHSSDIRYGIEQFFVQEGKGRELEQIRGFSGGRQIAVEIYVLPDGRASLKRCGPRAFEDAKQP